jgi:hypothetical protein
MDITFDREVDYTPDWMGNSANEEPFHVRIKILTYEERQKAMTVTLRTGQGAEITQNFSEAVRIGVVSVTGLTVSGKPIKTATEIVETPGLTALVDEVGAVILNRSMAPELKN